MTDSRTVLVGLIGWPVEHSLSPVMHNAAFAKLGLNWQYVALPVQPGQAINAIKGLEALGLRGANVTVPHKQAVLPGLDWVADEAVRLGAVNTVIVERDGQAGSRVKGHNTDAAGLRAALAYEGIELAGKRAVVVGAGGAARAAAHALIGAGVKRLSVLNRDAGRALALATQMRASEVVVAAGPLSPGALAEHTADADLLINATAAGMWPNGDESIWPEEMPVPRGLVVFDLVYNPRETRLLRQAWASGAQAIGGLEMLVQQGALAFELWTGCAAPVDVMRSACRAALGG